MEYTPPKVYVIQRDDGLVKVGQSRWPQTRVSGARSKHKRQVTLIGSWDTTPHAAEYVEGEVIHRLAEYHVFGEWFSAPVEHVIGVIKEMIAKPAGACRLKSQTATRLRGGVTGYPKIEMPIDPDVFEILQRLAGMRSRGDLGYIFRPILEAVAWRALPYIDDPDFKSIFTAYNMPKALREKHGLLGARKMSNIAKKAHYRHQANFTPADIAEEVIAKAFPEDD